MPLLGFLLGSLVLQVVQALHAHVHPTCARRHTAHDHLIQCQQRLLRMRGYLLLCCRSRTCISSGSTSCRSRNLSYCVAIIATFPRLSTWGILLVLTFGRLSTNITSYYNLYFSILPVFQILLNNIDVNAIAQNYMLKTPWILLLK